MVCGGAVLMQQSHEQFILNQEVGYALSKKQIT